MSVNALRGHLAEFGLVVAKGIGRVDELLALAQADARLPQIAKATVTELAQHLEGLDQSIDAIDDDIARAHRKNPKSCLIDQVPGIGTLILRWWPPALPIRACSNRGATSRPGWG